mmetsp:Transcript_66992/g.187258  ORF Transcript_66992/g.187258 Transcript_66992/m.187258 type:complete len:216 (-) Transcript_66992:309-956(-)
MTGDKVLQSKAYDLGTTPGGDDAKMRPSTNRHKAPVSVVQTPIRVEGLRPLATLERNPGRLLASAASGRPAPSDTSPGHATGTVQTSCPLLCTWPPVPMSQHRSSHILVGRKWSSSGAGLETATPICNSGRCPAPGISCCRLARWVFASGETSTTTSKENPWGANCAKASTEPVAKAPRQRCRRRRTGPASHASSALSCRCSQARRCRPTPSPSP